MKFRLLLAAAALVLCWPGIAAADAAFTTGNVNMRAGPSTAYPRILTIPRGAAVEVMGCLSDWNWCDTGWRGYRGWVSASYLEMLYQQRRVYVPEYAPRIGVPVITFEFGSYWDRWYRDRPWYRDRDRWERRRDRDDDRRRFRRVERDDDWGRVRRIERDDDRGRRIRRIERNDDDRGRRVRRIERDDDRRQRVQRTRDNDRASERRLEQRRESFRNRILGGDSEPRRAERSNRSRGGDRGGRCPQAMKDIGRCG